MNYKLISMVNVCVLALVGSCNREAKSLSNVQVSQAGSSDIPVRAQLLPGVDSSWKVSGTLVNPSEDLVDVQLIDNNNGKAAGAKGTIFETQDGGRSWQRLRGGLPANPEFVRICFVNRSLGWAVVMKSQPSPSDTGSSYDAFLMRTEDGGATWSNQYTIKNGSLSQIRFVNDREGWAAGSTRGPEGGAQTEHLLILHTLDRGLHWTDSFMQAAEQRTDDSAEDIHVDTAATMFLTTNGAIFNTADAGKNWNMIKMPEPDYPQLANLRLAIDQSHRLWVLSSANSREVAATVLARRDSNGDWATIQLADWYISDVKFLSPSQIIVCGFVGKKVEQQPLQNTEGIVAFSADNGKTWKIILRTKDAPRINSLAVISQDQLLALGNNGWAFKIQKSSETAD